jgi:hypothetical protein
MHRIVTTLFAVGTAGLWVGSGALADGILPDRDNRILIQGDFKEPSPGFLLVFSAKPLRDAQERLLTSATSAELNAFKTGPDQVVVKVHGKPPSRPKHYEYCFGTTRDADRPWNDGREFHWKDWEKSSPDVWDNVCILALPADGPDRKPSPGVIDDVAIFKGGKVLFDSRAKESYPNKKRIDTSIKPFTLTAKQGKHPILNLAAGMEKFRRDYYELGDNRILRIAYADLGQTDKRKYANRGNNWCSEFSSYVFRASGLMTPDPNQGDVHWKNMRAFFEKNGNVYALREVAGWSNEKKLSLIKPGSFVSMLFGDSSHSIIFTTWVVEPGKPVTRFVGVSGNNKGMVWPHAPIKLPGSEDVKGMSAAELREYDQKTYFGVPGDAK